MHRGAYIYEWCFTDPRSLSMLRAGRTSALARRTSALTRDPASDESYRSIKACCVRISKAYAPARYETGTGGAMRFTDLIKS